MNNQKPLNPLIDFLKIPSVSTQDKYKPDMQRARQYLVDLFKSKGFKTKILKGKFHDAVFASLATHSSLPTLLIYGHYDVQPPEPLSEWKTAPFKPIVKGDNLFARGATDDKGQLMIHIMAVKTLLEKSTKPPINFKFIIEGEEEIGSPSVANLAQKYAKNLFTCDYLIVSDSEMPAKNQPSIDISLRGLIYTEVSIQTAKHDVHSGQFGGVAENPVILLTRIINKLKDENNKITIPGFYDDVVKASKQELRDFLKVKINREKLKEEGGLFIIGGGEEEYTLNERRWLRPTLDINGIWGGYTDEGTKTIIPSYASAKISMRLVPNQNPDKIFDLFKTYVMSLVPKGVKVEVKNLAGAQPYKAPTNHPVFTLMKKGLNKAFGKDPLYTGVGGSIGFIPIAVKALGVPCLMVGFGLPTDNLHAPNEHFSLDNYFKGIDAMTDFYSKLSSLH